MGSSASKPAAVLTKATRAGAAAASQAASESSVVSPSSSARHPPLAGPPPPPSQRAPQPDALTGFYRGGAVSDRERSQEQFWRERDGGGPKEMPPELIKFMSDIGPLKKQEDVSQPTNKNQTLPSSSSTQKKKRAPRGLREEDAKEETEGTSVDSTTSSSSSSTTRRRESMRLVEGIEGYETPRTTNFSTVQEQVDPNDVGVDLLDIYSLLRGNTCAVVENTALDEAARQKQDELFRHTKEYLGLPALLKDSDGSYIGAWPENVEQLKEEHKGMHELPKTKVIAVMEDLWEIEQKKKEAA